MRAEELARGTGPIAFDRIAAWRVSIPMTEPFRISSGEVATKDAILVRVESGTAFGWGESSPMAGAFYSEETPDSCERELVHRVLPALAGRSFENLLELEAALAGLSESRFVRVAVETAAWEMAARERRVSLSTLFGIAGRPVPSGLAVGLYDTADELCAAIERYEYRQYKRLKIKIKRGQDVALVEAVRKRVGDYPLFVDANADYGASDLGIFRELDGYSLMMFEQPMGRHDLEASAALQRAVRTPVCLDESIETLEDARRARDVGACRIINIKLQRVGGFLEALRIVEFCEAAGLPVWMGTMPELGIGSAQALVVAAHPAFVFPTDVEPSARWYRADVIKPEMVLRDGSLTVPEGPGLGFEVDPDALDRHATARWTF